MESENRHKWKVNIKRIQKSAMVRGKLRSALMWGLFALEPIPAGAFVVEYVGEILTAKDGDKRGRYYDQLGMSYLFDMNDIDDTDDYDVRVQKSYYNDFFPLCVDATFCGNESRFINHSCDPNLKSFNIVTQVESYSFHKIAIFSSRNISAG